MATDWPVYLDDGGCTSCPFENQDGLCMASMVLQLEERACWYDRAPDWCFLRTSNIIVRAYGGPAGEDQ